MPTQNTASNANGWSYGFVEKVMQSELSNKSNKYASSPIWLGVAMVGVERLTNIQINATLLSLSVLQKGRRN